MKTKIAFNDIPNAIGRDEMKEVVGGGYAITTDNSIDHGFSADLKPFSWILDLGGGGKGGSSSWHVTANGMSTSNASDISRFFEYITGQSNGQNISNFNPNMSQIYSFVAGEIKFAAAGTITLPNGTVWGGELNNVNVYHTTDPRSPNYNPYGQWDASTVAGVFQNMGDSISGFGIGLSATG
ncbi:hypothetical protein, partial [Flavobacterium sp.]|uniref:hypothetical protein n=1 Tax=Flavobacterium sp. TaxID=239 RepID=UPI002623EE39